MTDWNGPVWWWKPGEESRVILTAAPTGLVGTLRLKIERADGDPYLPFSTADIEEPEPHTYVATRSAPEPGVGTLYIAYWDNPDDPEVVIPADGIWVSSVPPNRVEVEGEWPAPSLEQVAVYLPTRTKDAFGNVQRNDTGQRIFNDKTTPTEDEVLNTIDTARGIVVSDVGSSFCDKPEAEGFSAKAQDLAALYAAMLIELGFFPEQVRRDQSPYPNLKTLYDERRKALRSEIEEICGDVPGADPGDGGGVVSPSYGFDRPVTPIGDRILW